MPRKLDPALIALKEGIPPPPHLEDVAVAMEKMAKRRGRPPKVAVAAAAPPPPPPTPTKTTGQWLMALRKLIQETTGKPWPSVAMLNPTMDGPYDPFVLKARLATGNQWVGEYSPYDITEADLPGMVADLIAVREEAVKEASQRFDDDGEPLNDPRVIGKVVKVAGYEVIARDRTPIENMDQEAARISKELDAAVMVEIDHEGPPVWVQWMGKEAWVTEDQHSYPHQIAYAYRLQRRDRRDQGMPIDLEARMAAGLPQIPSYNELNGHLSKQVAPGRRG